MPEGPSLVILYEQVKKFRRKKILEASGNASIEISSLPGQTVRDIRVWGKQFFFCLKDQVIRIHFLLFGSYSLDTQTKPDKSLRLRLQFANGEIFFYTCSVKLITENIDEVYDWKADVMSDLWDPRAARKKLKAQPDMLVCDALLDQQIFSGVGNIIKNEVLYRIRVHPESTLGALPPRKLTELIEEARNYSFDFLKWKKKYVLRKHWLAHTKKTCKRCEQRIIKKYAGVTGRRTFFCESCQVLYGKSTKKTPTVHMKKLRDRLVALPKKRKVGAKILQSTRLKSKNTV